MIINRIIDNAAVQAASVLRRPVTSARAMAAARPVTDGRGASVFGLKGKYAALLANHGGLVLGRDLEQALENLRVLDWLSSAYLRARQVGEPRALSEDELAEARRRDTYGWAGPDPF